MCVKGAPYNWYKLAVVGCIVAAPPCVSALLAVGTSPPRLDPGVVQRRAQVAARSTQGEVRVAPGEEAAHSVAGSASGSRG